MSEDSVLLRRFVETRSEAAFAELVRQHLRLVYAVALRQVGGDAHLAEDVTQQVFTSLARKAPSLRDRPTLAGWLYRSTHFAASDVVRVERRRREREQKAIAMEASQETGPSVLPAESPIDWEQVRPAIDSAIAELDERDRDAVALRFFENRSFAEVGGRLNLTENGARMRVERALDKLHAALSRRGVKSTSAAVAMALAQQIVAAPPAGLAAVVAGAAVSGVAASAGLVSILASGKVLGALGVGTAAAALGVAGVQYSERASAEQQHAIAQRELRTMRADFARTASELEHVRARSAEAERDNATLLKAMEDARAQLAARSAAPAPVTAAKAASDGNDERLAQERAYQQQLAKRRAEEAIARAKIESEAAADPDAEVRYHRFMAAAEKFAAEADFVSAVRSFNTAMQFKPATTPISDRARELQLALRDQNKPVEITLISDGITTVSLVGPYAQRPPSAFVTATVKAMPANYEVVGKRKGFQDVVIPVQVRGNLPAPVVTVRCTVPETINP